MIEAEGERVKEKNDARSRRPAMNGRATSLKPHEWGSPGGQPHSWGLSFSARSFTAGRPAGRSFLVELLEQLARLLRGRCVGVVADQLHELPARRAPGVVQHPLRLRELVRRLL